MAEFSDDQLDKIQKSMRVISLSDNEHLFEQGEQADRFYQVLSGQIKLFRVSMEGSERVIEVVQPGQTFAEAVMFMDERCYPLNAEALGKTELLAFDSSTFLKILADSKQACFRLLADMSMRLHHRLNEIDYLTLQNATFRMVNYLLQQIPKGHNDDEAIEVKLTTSKSIIASRLSIQPETFSRILKNLSKRGLIDVKGKTITLLDIDNLRNFEA
ncbi:MAG: Crp/Fnr family transcriptional regulator [Gammaproteobacteria bacterium]|nr:Crp/Fnr family transcriptional regulator [Gammaproteobacteria bacterium]